MQFFKPENYFLVRKALLQAGRRDLIGDGCGCLIPATPRKEALLDRRERATREARDGDYVHSRQRTPQSPARSSRGRSSIGYRPHRKGASHRRHKL